MNTTRVFKLTAMVATLAACGIVHAQAAPYTFKRSVPTLVVTQPAVVTPTPSSGGTPVDPPGAGGGSTGTDSGGTGGNTGGTPASTTKTVDLSALAVDFGDVDVGNLLSRSVALLNTGTGLVSLTTAPALYASPTAFQTPRTTCGTTLEAGQSCVATVTFAPTAFGGYAGKLQFRSDATPSLLEVSLSGVGRQALQSLSADSSASFGAVDIGTTVTRAFSLKNVGNKDIPAAYVAKTGSNLTLQLNECGTQASPVPLPAGVTCHFELAYTPTAVDTLAGTLTAVSSAANSPSALTLSGSGIVPVTTQSLAALTTLDFGTVTVGNTGSLNFRLTNTGNKTMTGVAVSASGNSAVRVSSTDCGTTQAPSTLGAGAYCSITVSYTPTATETLSNVSLRAASSATNSPTALTLTGSGLLTTSVATLVSGDLTFGTANQGDTVAARTLTFRNDGTKPMTLTGLSGLPGPLSVTSNNCTSKAAAATCTVVVSASTGSQGNWSTTVSTVGADTNATLPATFIVSAPYGGAGLYSTPGTYNFVVPTGVTAIHAVAVGAGGAGIVGSNGPASGGGGALAYVNNIAVTPGETLTVVVGLGATSGGSNGTPTNGGDSYIARGATKLVGAGGGKSAVGTGAVSSTYGGGGTVLVGTGGAGGSGAKTYYSRAGGGGGAGGYAGTGGYGGGTWNANSSTMTSAGSGSGGAAAGGAGNSTAGQTGGGGGGTGMYGLGASGAATGSPYSSQGGAAGSPSGSTGTAGASNGQGGFPGGGAGAPVSNVYASGGNGAVRIIWGAGRSFPSTNVSGTP